MLVDSECIIDLRHSYCYPELVVMNIVSVYLYPTPIVKDSLRELIVEAYRKRGATYLVEGRGKTGRHKGVSLVSLLQRVSLSNT